jgi:hypothetical protein
LFNSIASKSAIISDTSGNSWFFVATRSTLFTSFLSILRQLVLSLTNVFKATSICPDLSRVSTSSIGRAATAPWSIQRLGVLRLRVMPTLMPDEFAK